MEQRNLENIDPNKPPKPKVLPYDLDAFKADYLTFKERKTKAEELAVAYMTVYTPEERMVPGFEAPMNSSERVKEGVDCDEVFPRIVLGNGATLRKTDYLKSIRITHILNAAESRGVNVGSDYFGPAFGYMGLKVEDTPQTQICRYVSKVRMILALT